ncbi:hypothetical protein CHH86_09350, partial [Bacillus paralicheniformis]
MILLITDSPLLIIISLSHQKSVMYFRAKETKNKQTGFLPVLQQPLRFANNIKRPAFRGPLSV